MSNNCWRVLRQMPAWYVPHRLLLHREASGQRSNAVFSIPIRGAGNTPPMPSASASRRANRCSGAAPTLIDWAASPRSAASWPRMQRQRSSCALAAARCASPGHPSNSPLASVVPRVINRQTRWAQLRRMTFPRYFLPEIWTGSLLPTVAGAFASRAARRPRRARRLGIVKRLVRARSIAGAGGGLAAELAIAVCLVGSRCLDPADLATRLYGGRL